MHFEQTQREVGQDPQDAIGRLCGDARRLRENHYAAAQPAGDARQRAAALPEDEGEGRRPGRGTDQVWVRRRFPSPLFLITMTA